MNRKMIFAATTMLVCGGAFAQARPLHLEMHAAMQMVEVSAALFFSDADTVGPQARAAFAGDDDRANLGEGLI